MSVQNVVNLTGANRVAYRLLVCRLNFADFHKLTFLGPGLKRGKYRSFFLKAHITVITAIMIPGDCFQSMIPIFRHQLAHIGCMEARCLRNLTEFHTLCSQFKCFQSCIRTFVLCLSACCLYCGHFLIAEFIVRCHYSSPRYSIAYLVRRLKCFTRFLYQNLSRELFSVADEHGGKLPNRVVFYCDELGTMPPFDILPLFSAGRSRKLTLVPIIQSLAQLEKNYGKEGAEIIGDNCQDTIFGGFAPNSQTAETLSKALGSRTVLTGSISKGKDSNSQSLQMAERALLSPDELKNLPKGNFIVMKTGTHPMRTKLQLYFKWGISFEEPYQVPERAQREVYYAGKEELLMNIKKNLYSQPKSVSTPKADDYMSSYGDK